MPVFAGETPTWFRLQPDSVVNKEWGVQFAGLFNKVQYPRTVPCLRHRDLEFWQYIQQVLAQPALFPVPRNPPCGAVVSLWRWPSFPAKRILSEKIEAFPFFARSTVWRNVIYVQCIKDRLAEIVHVFKLFEEVFMKSLGQKREGFLSCQAGRISVQPEGYDLTNL